MTNAHAHSPLNFQALFPQATKSDDLVMWEGFSKTCQRLKIACEQKYPLILLHGQPGSGKSSAVKWLYDQLPQEDFDFFLTALSSKEIRPGWFLDRFSRFLGIHTKENFQDVMLKKIQELIDDKQHMVIVIDGADRLENTESMEELEVLLGYQSLVGAALSIVLVSQEDLIAKIIHKVPAIANYVALRIELKNPSESEWEKTARAFQARANMPEDVLSTKVLNKIHELCKSNLKKSMMLCENALVEMQLHHEQIVNFEHLKIAAQAALIDVGGMDDDTAQRNPEQKEQSAPKQNLKLAEKPSESIASEASETKIHPKKSLKDPQSDKKTSQPSSKQAWSSLMDED